MLETHMQLPSAADKEADQFIQDAFPDMMQENIKATPEQLKSIRQQYENNLRLQFQDQTARFGVNPFLPYPGYRLCTPEGATRKQGIQPIDITRVKYRNRSIAKAPKWIEADNEHTRDIYDMGTWMRPPSNYKIRECLEQWFSESEVTIIRMTGSCVRCFTFCVVNISEDQMVCPRGCKVEPESDEDVNAILRIPGYKPIREDLAREPNNPDNTQPYQQSLRQRDIRPLALRKYREMQKQPNHPLRRALLGLDDQQSDPSLKERYFTTATEPEKFFEKADRNDRQQWPPSREQLIARERSNRIRLTCMTCRNVGHVDQNCYARYYKQKLQNTMPQGSVVVVGDPGGGQTYLPLHTNFRRPTYLPTYPAPTRPHPRAEGGARYPFWSKKG
jgi:hypothetical protein